MLQTPRRTSTSIYFFQRQVFTQRSVPDKEHFSSSLSHPPPLWKVRFAPLESRGIQRWIVMHSTKSASQRSDICHSSGSKTPGTDGLRTQRKTLSCTISEQAEQRETQSTATLAEHSWRAIVVSPRLSSSNPKCERWIGRETFDRSVGSCTFP